MTQRDEFRPQTAGAAGSQDDAREPARSGAQEPRRVLRVRSPEDLLAAVPVALGFVPHNSVVMLSLGPSGGPHARVDLGADTSAGHLDALASTLLDVVRLHDVARVALVVYGPLGRAGVALTHLLGRLADEGSQAPEVVAAVAADGSRWRGWASPSSGGAHPTSQARDYDARSHRFAAEAVLAGEVVHASRAALAASIEPSPLLVAEVGRHGQEDAPACEPAEVIALLRRATAGELTLTPRQIAVLRRSVKGHGGRDATWSWVQRSDVRAHVDLWRHVVRSCAYGQAADEASVLAFHAWLAGDGALAWCALDRSCEGGPSTSLGVLVGELLERAVSPHGWAAMMASAGHEADVVDLRGWRHSSKGAGPEVTRVDASTAERGQTGGASTPPA